MPISGANYTKFKSDASAAFHEKSPRGFGPRIFHSKYISWWRCDQGKPTYPHIHRHMFINIYISYIFISNARKFEVRRRRLQYCTFSAFPSASHIWSSRTRSVGHSYRRRSWTRKEKNSRQFAFKRFVGTPSIYVFINLRLVVVAAGLSISCPSGSASSSRRKSEHPKLASQGYKRPSVRAMLCERWWPLHILHIPNVTFDVEKKNNSSFTQNGNIKCL